MNRHLSRLRAGAVCALLACSLHAVAQDVPHFAITRYAVEGNTLLTQQEVDALLQPYTGEKRDFGDVQRALEALETVYRQRGYSLVQVALPEQELDQGVVRLQVIETKIGKIKVEGNTAFSEANIRNSLPQLTEGSSPKLDELSPSLKMANENPAKKTTLQLQNGATDDTVDAVVKVEDERPWHISTMLDNDGNKRTGKTQLTVQYQHANIADLDHVLSLQYTTTIEHPDKVSVYGVGYHIPLYSLGDSIDLFASRSDVDSGSVLSGIINMQVSGQGTIFGARYNQNLRRIGDYESQLTYGIDYKAYENDCSGTIGAVDCHDPALNAVTDVTVHPISLAYSGSLASGPSQISFGIAGLRNIPGGDNGRSDDFDKARSGASASYRILRYNAGYARLLPSDWQLRLNFSGQYTTDALVSGEQFGAGGATTVRGFLERDASKDKGYLFNAELYTPNLCTGVEHVSAQCRLLAFYDAAHLSNNKSLPGESARESLASVGLGLRLNVGKAMAMQLDIGRVLDAGPSENTGDTRAHVRVALTY